MPSQCLRAHVTAVDASAVFRVWSRKGAHENGRTDRQRNRAESGPESGRRRDVIRTRRRGAVRVMTPKHLLLLRRVVACKRRSENPRPQPWGQMRAASRAGISPWRPRFFSGSPSGPGVCARTCIFPAEAFVQDGALVPIEN